jgi:spore coat polysaccharide biosynthesis predicted glycosyltransferase SpsG
MGYVQFITEASQEAGFGHLSRSLALAESIKQNGNEVCFHGFIEKDSEIMDLFKTSGIIFGTCQCKFKTICTIVDVKNGIFVAESEIYSKKIIQLVDNDTADFKANGYIKVSPIKKWKAFNKIALIKEFNYDPLVRDIFFHSHNIYDKRIPDLNPRVFISLGGNPNKNILNSIIDNLVRINPRTQILLPKKYIDHGLFKFNNVFALDVKDFLQNCNEKISFAIVSAGVTMWEFLALGFPIYILATNKDQLFQYETIKHKFNISGLDVSDTTDLSKFSYDFDLLLKQPPTLVRKITNKKQNYTEWLRANFFI